MFTRDSHRARATRYLRVALAAAATAATVGGHDSSVCTDPTKGATWVAGLDGPLWMTGQNSQPVAG